MNAKSYAYAFCVWIAFISLVSFLCTTFIQKASFFLTSLSYLDWPNLTGFSTEYFSFFHFSSSFCFFTFFTSQNELKTAGINKVFTAVLPQKCLKFFRLGTTLRSGLGKLKNSSSGGGAQKNDYFLHFFQLGTLFFSLLLPVYNAYSNHFARIFKL